MRPSTAMAWSGLVPQVIVGATARRRFALRARRPRRRRSQAGASRAPRRRKRPCGAKRPAAQERESLVVGCDSRIGRPVPPPGCRGEPRPRCPAPRWRSRRTRWRSRRRRPRRAWPMCSARSLGVTPCANSPSQRMRMRLGLRWRSVCVASAWLLSDEPTPKASAPRPPLVQVWLSLQMTVRPGSTMPSSGPITCTMPCPAGPGRRSGRRPRGDAVAQRRVELAAGGKSCHPARLARDRVVGRREDELGVARLQPARCQLGESGRPPQVVQQLAVDVQQGPAVAELAHDVRIPELVEQGAAVMASVPSRCRWSCRQQRTGVAPCRRRRAVGSGSASLWPQKPPTYNPKVIVKANGDGH